MRRVLLFVVFAFVASTATGCIIESGSGDDGPPDEDGLITANWSFRSVETGASVGCPGGDFTTTTVYAHPVNASGDRLGAPFIRMYSCADGTGTTAYPLDRYEVYVEITNATGTSVYAQSLSSLVDIIDNDATFTTTIIDDGGFFQFDWELRAKSDGAVLTCTQAGATGGVDITATLNSTMEATTDVYPCENGTAITGALLSGTYTVSIAALDSLDRSISDTPALTNKVIQAPNRVTDLGLIMIPITDL